MCTSYESNPKDRFDVFSLFPAPNFDYKRDIYKDYDAPIFRRFDGAYSTDAATFGLVPRKFIPKGAKVFTTMNARSETVGQKESFRSAWNKLQLALIPCNRFYEPNYETGKAVRWRIGTAGGAPLAIAGLWREWKDPTDGSRSLSMTMLTVNADDHPLMKRFHKPGAEKRSVVIIPRPNMRTGSLARALTKPGRFCNCTQRTRCMRNRFLCRLASGRSRNKILRRHRFWPTTAADLMTIARLGSAG